MEFGAFKDSIGLCKVENVRKSFAKKSLINQGFERFHKKISKNMEKIVDVF
jgi:hypothetical protein